MIYMGERAGITHRYEIGPEALKYTAGTRTRVEIKWKDLVRLEPARGEALSFVSTNRERLAVWLEPEKMKQFLNESLTTWARANRSAALKSSFDYGAAQAKAGGWAMLVVSLLFPGLLALMLLPDAFHTLKCNRLLASFGQLATAQVEKVTKDRRGNFIWKLAFNSASGTPVSGKRPAFEYDAKGFPKGDVSVVYAPSDLSCWDVSLKPGQAAPNFLQRDFFLYMSMGFGGFFALVAALGCAISIRKIRRRHPFADEVLAFVSAVTK